MRARVKKACRWNTVTAFNGRDYVRDDWRRVPAGLEAEAQRHPMLELRIDALSEPAGTLEQLKQRAKAAGIPNYWSMKRERLLKELDDETIGTD